MPTKAVAAETMEVGKKGGGKNWTKAEVAARKKAAAALKRKKVQIDPPDWLESGALLVWNRVINDAAELNILDNLDVDMLAIYCDAVDQHTTLAKKKMKEDAEVKMMQSWARIIAKYADQLGFTPQARARLAKKVADDGKDPFGDEFD